LFVGHAASSGECVTILTATFHVYQTYRGILLKHTSVLCFLLLKLLFNVFIFYLFIEDGSK